MRKRVFGICAAATILSGCSATPVGSRIAEAVSFAPAGKYVVTTRYQYATKAILAIDKPELSSCLVKIEDVSKVDFGNKAEGLRELSRCAIAVTGVAASLADGKVVDAPDADGTTARLDHPKWAAIAHGADRFSKQQRLIVTDFSVTKSPEGQVKVDRAVWMLGELDVFEIKGGQLVWRKDGALYLDPAGKRIFGSTGKVYIREGRNNG